MNRLLLFCLLCLTQTLAFATSITPISVSGNESLDLDGKTYVLERNDIKDIDHVIAESNIYWRAKQISDTQMIGAHNYWLQFKLTTPEDTAKRILEIGNPHIDHIEIYHYINGRLSDKQVMGDSYPFSERPIKKIQFYYPIELKKGQIHDIYLKIDSQGSAHIPLVLSSAESYFEEVDNLPVAVGVHLGSLLGIGIFSLFFAFVTRSFSYGYFSGYVLSMTLTIATIDGLSYKYLWPESPFIQAHSLPALIPIALAFALLLTEKILKLKKQNYFMLKFCRIGALVSILIAVLSLFISYKLALLIEVNAVLAVVIVLMVLTVIQAIKGHKLAKLYSLGWSAIMLGAGATCLVYLGIISLSVAPQVPVIYGLTVEILVMTLILAICYHDERKEKMRIQQKALVQAERIKQVREDALNSEIQNKDQLEHMVQERTLELEFAYRELNEAHDRLKEQSSIDTLTGVKNRNAFDKKLLAEAKLSRRQQTPLAIMMLDIDKFKLINDTYGHFAGDQALKYVADSIKSELLRPSDIVARYGGEEFALLLPSTDAKGAKVVAEKIRRCIHDHAIRWQDNNIFLTVSIGLVADIVTDDAHARVMFEQADKALYHAKDNGRDQVREFTFKLEQFAEVEAEVNN
ncbi:GGDEF domain-containing protein [Shewanella sp. 202IG2-18]|uniref:sensor domain-containing diguanylate cyclase n=1 Tax=Parashewanella hymeniacidonis TaxID=2807618 RepID=UPI001961B4E4|nr:diguanylate cyclase [Parashewanella hymeniacidonis]MBM7073395.1 GGDEF domain-containing protein [Parashewanella hymeniacidonis]